MRSSSILMTTLAIVFLAVACTYGADDRPAKSETFDRDPGWDSHNNRTPDKKPKTVVEDFGYNATNHARGKAAGEIGGKIVRTSRTAYYLKPLERAMTMDDPLHATGQFVVTETGGTSSFMFGWFNKKTIGSGTYPTDNIRVRFNGEAKGVELIAIYTTSKNESEGTRITGVGPNYPKTRDFILLPINTVYTFDWRYDPKANDGNGQILFTLGGDGPHTVKDVVVNIIPGFRKTGAQFDCFGIVDHKAEPGGTLGVYFDDMTLNGQPLTFDEDPQWLALNNRITFDDYLKRGEHDFGYEPGTQIAGGKPGEIGGLMYSDNWGYYGDDIGQLTLDDHLVATGRLALTERSSEAGLYIGWFNSEGRGYPPKNLIGVVAEGPNSLGSMFRPIYGTSNPEIGATHNYAAVIDPNGRQYQWRIEYDPKAAEGLGELKVSLNGETSVLTLTPEARKQNAVFDRFGLAIFEKGGQWSKIYLDDLTYTTGRE